MSCLDAAAVQGFVEGSLDDRERAAVEAHLDGCDTCRRWVAALAANDASGIATDRTVPAAGDVATDRTVPAAGDVATDRTVPAVGNLATDRTIAGTDAPSRALGHALAVGTVVDRYRVTGYLGKGGMGIVYAAHDPELRRDVALKLLHPERSSSAGAADLQARLLREAQAMAQVAHPNVISVYDVGTWDGEVFLTMELATAGTLRAWCKQARSSAQILDAYLAAGRGLAAAHAAGLVHRDFKPDNVLVGADGRVRVTDFGLARSHDAPKDRSVAGTGFEPLSTLTATGAVMGTPGYMAPEQFAGEPADARTDQFAFCVALWEALFGRRPFAGAIESVDELAKAVAANRITEPPRIRGVDRALEVALRRGLEPRPDARWPSMDALLAALVVKPRRRWRYAAAAVLLLAGGGAAVFAVTRGPADGSLRPASEVAAVPGDATPDVLLGPDDRKAFMDIMPRISKAQMLALDGRFDEAKPKLAEAVALARTYHSPLTLMNALMAQGDALKTAGDLAGAEKALREARHLAESLGDDSRKTAIAVDLADVLAAEGKHEEADDVRAMSKASASRREVDDANRARALEAEAEATADLTAATAKWDEALARRDKLGDLAGRSNNRVRLAGVLNNADRGEQARDLLLANLAVIEAREKAMTAAAGASAGSNASPPGRALVVTGSVAVLLAKTATLSMLILVENGLHRWADAEAHARQAITVATGRLPPATLGVSFLGLGSALLGKGDRKAAEEAFARAEELDANQPLQLANTHGMIALSESDHGDLHAAIHHTEVAVALLEKAFGSDYASTQDMQIFLCKLLNKAGQRAQARQIGEALLPKVEAVRKEPMVLGDARFMLARALPKSERARAKALGLQARTAYEAAGAADRLKAIDAWLADPDIPRLP